MDGFLLTDVEVDDPRFAVLEAAGVPVVLAGDPAGDCPFPWVETRHDEGMAPPVAHLAALGHARIAFFGGRADLEHVRVREARWRSAVAAAGLGRVGRARRRGPGRRRVRAAGRADRGRVRERRARAGAGGGGADAGLDVPGDVSVTGFDDSPLAALGMPALTSVRVDYAEFGEAAAGALLAEIGVTEAGAFSPSAPELVERASTARRAVGCRAMAIGILTGSGTYALPGFPPGVV